MEVITEEYDGEEDLEVTEIVETIVEVIEVAGEDEIPDSEVEEIVVTEIAEKEEPVEDAKADEALE